MSRLSAIRGMNDILPEATSRWQQLETTLRTLMQRYGYHEIRLPVVEPTALFKRKREKSPVLYQISPKM